MPAFVIQESPDFPGPLTQSLDFGPDPLILSFGAALTGSGNQILPWTTAPTPTRTSGDILALANGVLQCQNVGWFEVYVQYTVPGTAGADSVTATLAAGSGAVVMGGDNSGTIWEYDQGGHTKTFQARWMIYNANGTPSVTLTIAGPTGVSIINGGVIAEQVA